MQLTSCHGFSANPDFVDCFSLDCVNVMSFGTKLGLSFIFQGKKTLHS